MTATRTPRRPSPARRSLALGGAVLLAVTTMAACGSEGSPRAEAPTSPTASPSTDVDVPKGVELTAPGTELDLGEPATVVSEPNQNVGTVLRLSVESIRRASIRDFKQFILDARTKKSRPYYVDVRVKNLGPDDLGGNPVPLYGMAEDDTLIQSSAFTTPFAPCSSTPLPNHFRRGDSVKRCLVYLAPDGGKIDTVSFRPDQDVAGVTWTGEVTLAKPADGKGGKAGKQGKQGKQGKSGKGGGKSGKG